MQEGNSTDTTKTLVIIPTLNEKENIADIIQAVCHIDPSFHILIVDDSSSDGTIEIVQEMAHQQEKLNLLVRKDNFGLGKAYIDGFKWALNKSYTFIVEMDADFSHNPKDIPRLVNSCLKNHGVCVGSRYVDNKINVVNWDFKRLLLSYFASRYVKLITNMPVYDTTAGFVCYHRKVIEKINLNEIKFTGYAFQIEMKFRAWKLGFPIKEVSIIFTDRKKGQSKMNASIIREAVLGVLKLRWMKLN